MTNKKKIFESVESLEMGSIGSAVLPFTDKQSTIYRFSSFAVYRQAKYNISVQQFCSLQTSKVQYIGDASKLTFGSVDSTNCLR